MSVFAIRNGGLAIYGGIIFAALAIIIYCKVKKIDFGIPFDLLAVGLPMAQAIGRWGNFVNAEAFGGETNLPWGMVIGNSSNMVHPTFLYESLWNVLSVVIVLLVKRHKKFEGEGFCAYMIWYGIGRFWIEGLRADSLYFGIFRVSQLVSLLLVVLGAGIVINKRICQKKT
jgi:phosphatidylglycerol:prolipoprotein diacylglycerol transferase